MYCVIKHLWFTIGPVIPFVSPGADTNTNDRTE